MDTTHTFGSRRDGDSGPQNSDPTAIPEYMCKTQNSFKDHGYYPLRVAI